MRRMGMNLFFAVMLAAWGLLPGIGHTKEAEESSSSRDQPIQSISIVPSILHLEPGETSRVRVIARTTDGTGVPVPDAVLTAKGKAVTVNGTTVKAVKQGNGKIIAAYRGMKAEAKVQVRKPSKGNPHSTYRFEYALPESVGTGKYITAPITLSTDKEGAKGYKNVHIAFEKATGPGDVLFRAKDKTGRVRSFLNTGEWMKPGFDLPAKHRETTDWTLKFSKVGHYTIIYKVKTEKGKTIAETPLDVTVTPHFTDLGVQIANLTIMTGAFGKDPSERPVGYTVVVGDPGKLVIVDLQSEKVIRTVDLPGATGSWTITAVGDEAVYVGTYPNGHVYKYIPGSDRVEDLGQPVPGTTVVYGLVPGKNGKIYGGTYPGGNLFEYDPAKGFSDLGQMVEGENYVRDVAYDPDKDVLYAGVGAHAHLIKNMIWQPGRNGRFCRTSTPKTASFTT